MVRYTRANSHDVPYFHLFSHQIQERKSELFFDTTTGQVVCSECWDDAKDGANDYDHLPYGHAKRGAEAYARYDDGDEAAEFRLSVRTAVIVDGAPLEESALVAEAQKLSKRFSKELYPGFSKCGQGDEEGAQDGTDESDGSDSEEWLKHYDGCDLKQQYATKMDAAALDAATMDATEWMQQRWCRWCGRGCRGSGVDACECSSSECSSSECSSGECSSSECSSGECSRMDAAESTQQQ